MKPKALSREQFLQARQFIVQDVLREVDLAKALQDPDRRPHLEAAQLISGSGNLLCALGLLCYTDFAAQLKYKDGNNKTKFQRFFRQLGPEYASLLDGGHDVYDIIRNGMVHNYYAHAQFKVWMYGAPDLRGGIIWKDGTYNIIVERYAWDLLSALVVLEGELYK